MILCLVSYSCSNWAGSWIFLNLITKKRVQTSQWQRMLMTYTFVRKMNDFCGMHGMN